MIVIGLSISKIKFGIDEEYAWWLTYACPVYRLGDFSLGLILGKIYKKENSYRKEIGVRIVTVIIVSVSIICYSLFSLPIGVKYTCLFIPGALLLTYCFATSKGIMTKILSTEFFISIGNISGYLYLVQIFIIRGLKNFCGLFGINFQRFFLVELLSVLTVSYITILLYLKIEKVVKERYINWRSKNA